MILARLRRLDALPVSMRSRLPGELRATVTIRAPDPTRLYLSLRACDVNGTGHRVFVDAHEAARALLGEEAAVAELDDELICELGDQWRREMPDSGALALTLAHADFMGLVAGGEIGSGLMYALAVHGVRTFVDETGALAGPRTCADALDPAAPLRAERLLRAVASLGSTRLARRELVALARGDILLIDRQDAVLSIGAQRLAGFHMNESTIRLQPDAGIEADPEGEPIVADLPVDRLLVEVRFSIGERMVSLEEIAHWGPGTVLELNTLATVRLLVGGHAVAEGELVQVGERLGVELQRVFLSR